MSEQIKLAESPKTTHEPKKTSGKVKTVTAVCGIALCLAVTFLAPLWGMCVLVTAVGIMMYYEFSIPTRFVRSAAVFIPGLIVSAIFPWLAFFKADISIYLSVILADAAAVFAVTALEKKHPDGKKLLSAIAAACVFPLLNTSVIDIMKHENGKLLIILPFLIAWGTDTFAQVTGKLLGKHKFAPDISPNKTTEGVVGGIIGGVVLTGIYCAVLAAFKQTVPAWQYLVFSLFGSALAVIGDLFFSYIKRGAGLKDFSSLMPGHGGILDRFDSVLFVLPLFASTLNLIK